MRTTVFSSEQFFDPPINEVFAFFANAANLENITPPWLSFKILTPQPIAMARGTLIDYRLSWHGIPLRWRTKITEWKQPSYFVDEQIKGPYRLWRHEHIFSEEPKGTRMIDRVTYAVPGGALIDKLFVGSDVRRIFDYRRAVLENIV